MEGRSKLYKNLLQQEVGFFDNTKSGKGHSRVLHG